MDSVMPVSTIPSMSPSRTASSISDASHEVNWSSSKFRTATKVRSRRGRERWLAMRAQSPVAMKVDMARRYGSVLAATTSSKSSLSCSGSPCSPVGLSPPPPPPLLLTSCSARETKRSSGWALLPSLRIRTASCKSPLNSARAVIRVYHVAVRPEPLFSRPASSILSSSAVDAPQEHMSNRNWR